MADEIKHTISIEANLTKIQSQLGTLEGNFNSSFGRIGNLAQSLGGVLGGALSIGGMIAFGKHVIDAGDQLSDLSDQTGNSIEVLGGIKPILEQNNSSLEAFAKGMGKAQRSLGDISGGGKEAAESLQAIGLSAAEMASLSPDEFLERLVKALAKVENRNQRAAIAFKILGKSAAESVPAILSLAENGIPKLDAQTTQAYKSLGQMKDQIVSLTAALTNLAAPLVSGILDTLMNVFNASELVRSRKELAALSVEIDKLNRQLTVTQTLPGRSFASKDDPTGEQRQLEESRSLQAKKAEAQKKFKSTFDLIAKLEGGPKTEGASKNLLPDNTQKETGIQDFLAGLQKQIDESDIKWTEVLSGPFAAETLRLNAQFDALIEQRKAKKLPIPEGFEKVFDNMRDAFLESMRATETLKLSLEQMPAVARMAEEELEFKLGIEGAKKAQDELNKATEEGLRIRAVPDIKLQDQLARNIEAELAKVREEAAGLEAVFGQSFDSAARNVDKTTQALEKLLGLNLGALDPRVQKLGSELGDLKTKAIAEGLARDLQQIDAQAKVFGAEFDSPTAKIQALENALKALAIQIGELEALKKIGSPIDEDALERARGKVQEFQTELKNEQGIKSLRESFESVFGAIEKGLDSTLNGVLEGTQKFGDAMTNLARNIMLSIANEFNKMLIINPLKKILTDLLPGSSGSGFGSAPAGMEGPSLPGGFFSTPLGAFANWFAGLFKEKGGLIAPLPLLHFARGGEVPAILHEGEFVIRRDSAQKLGPRLLGALNAGEIPMIPTHHFAFGGRVGSLAVHLPRYAVGGMVGGSGSDAMAGMGGGKTNVTINNNTGQPAQVERRKTFDTEEILVTIGKRMARDVHANRDVGRAIGETFGLGRAPINRG